jgi:hypothetical protein
MFLFYLWEYVLRKNANVMAKPDNMLHIKVTDMAVKKRNITNSKNKNT